LKSAELKKSQQKNPKIRNSKPKIKKLTRTITNIEDSKQLIKASDSVGANYIEATELMNIFGAIFQKSK
jgi:hypothetical protein